MTGILEQLINAISISSIFDIAIMAIIIYKILSFIKESRAEQLVKGLVLIALIATLSDLLKLYTINWLFSEAMTIGILALVILFQPELRRGLEQVGRAKIVSSALKSLDEDEGKSIVEEIAEALLRFEKEETGALVVIERNSSLEDIARVGTQLDAIITRELLGNVFYEGSPLHDGAIIIRGNKLLAAGCVLPLSENTDLPTELGTRHRAGIGISENSDAIALMVSEETGTISIAVDGVIKRNLEKEDLYEALNDVFFVKEPELGDRFKKIKEWAGGKLNVRK